MRPKVEESVVLPCPHCGFPIPVDAREFAYLKRIFRCPGCNRPASFPWRARLAGLGAMLAVWTVVVGFAKILGLGYSEHGATWGSTLIAIAVLVAFTPIAVAATRAACRRWTDRLVK